MKIKTLSLKDLVKPIVRFDSDLGLMDNSKNYYRIRDDIITLKKDKNFSILFSSLAKSIYLIRGNFEAIDQKKLPKAFVDPGLFTSKKNNQQADNYNFKSLSLCLNTYCNLNCKYCFASSGFKHKSLSFDSIKAIIDYFASLKDGSKVLGIIGEGEATLNFELLKETVNYARKRIDGLEQIFLDTNGVMSDDVVDFLIKNIDKINISFDGPPSIQDYMRPLKDGGRSSVLVEKTIKRLLEKDKDFTIRAVVSSHSIGKELEFVNYFRELGIKEVIFSPLKKWGKGKNTQILSNKEFIDFELRCAELFHDLGIVVDFQTLSILGRKVFPKCDIGCGMYNFGPSLDITSCQLFSSRHQLKNTFHIDDDVVDLCESFFIGRYSEKDRQVHIDEIKSNTLKDRYTKVRECQTCDFKVICGGGCPIEHITQSKSLYKADPKVCEDFKQRLSSVLLFFAERDLIRKKPYFLEKNGKMYFEMIYNQFPIKSTNNDILSDGSQFVTIKLEDLNKKKLISQINNHNSHKLNLLLLSFVLNDKTLSLEGGEAILDVLNTLNNRKIYFKVTRPLPKCLFGKDYEKIIKKYRIPSSCIDCLELYTVKNDGTIVFCDGRIGKSIDEYPTRDEIFDEFKKGSKPKLSNKCRFCKHRLKKSCDWDCIK